MNKKRKAGITRVSVSKSVLRWALERARESNCKIAIDNNSWVVMIPIFLVLLVLSVIFIIHLRIQYGPMGHFIFLQ